MKFIQFTFSLLILFVSNTSFGQEKMISGKITDKAGNPLPGVTIKFKKTNNVGTSSFRFGGKPSKIDGSYQVTLPNDFDSIAFTCVGFITFKEKIEGNNIMNITMVRETPSVSSISIEGAHKYSQTELNELNKKDKKNKLNKEDEIIMMVEIESEYIGGQDALKKYLKNNIIYPDSATISDVSGIVKVGFTVAKEGSIKNIVLIKGVNKFADETVINAISKMKKWRAAVQNGYFIEQYKEISVAFNIVGKVN